MLHEIGNSLDTVKAAPVAAKNHREVIMSLSDLQAQKEALDNEHGAKLAAIEAEKARTIEIKWPLDVMHGQHRELIERINNATVVYADQMKASAELDNALDILLGSPNMNGGRVNFGPIFNSHTLEPLVQSVRAVELFDRWFKRNRAKLADLEARMTAYATANNLTYALPVKLGGEAE